MFRSFFKKLIHPNQGDNVTTTRSGVLLVVKVNEKTLENFGYVVEKIEQICPSKSLKERVVFH